MPTWGQILKEMAAIQEPKTPLPSGLSIFDVTRRKYMAALHNHTKRNTIVYASDWANGAADPSATSMLAGDMQGFMEVVQGLQGNALDLILFLPGGSAEAAEYIGKYLRCRFSDIRVIVPHAAMSAATILACVADRIVMGKHSALGPIDPQFVMRTELGPRAFAAQAIIDQFITARQEVAANPNALPAWLPILRQFAPALLQQAQIAQQLSPVIVETWLKQYMLASDPTAASKTAQWLANHSRHLSHSRFIMRDEARSLGLVIDDLEADQTTQDLALSVFHAVTHTFNGTPAAKIIENHTGRAFIVQNAARVVVQAPQVKPSQPPPAQTPTPAHTAKARKPPARARTKAP